MKTFSISSRRRTIKQQIPVPICAVSVSQDGDESLAEGYDHSEEFLGAEEKSSRIYSLELFGNILAYLAASSKEIAPNQRNVGASKAA